jgi:glycosyltransferase involved in cell wall biosynthesis
MTSITNQNKLKVLVVSEASFLSSGFSIYTKEILSRLYKTQKYELAELACYGMVNDPRDKEIPWKYYANAVREDDPRYNDYMSRTDNQFGRWRFEKVLLDFRPDIVIDIRDYWMSAYQALSPLRNYFHWILMPTVDSAPQQEEWIDTFLSADSVFTYSDWGADVLKNQSSDKIKYIDTVSPGVDLSVFKSRSLSEKLDIRTALGIPKDAVLFGSVMRNQKRKLIPELICSFRKAIDALETSDPKLGSRLYLYLHTSYPDAGWDIPELLKEHRLANRVLFTYLCKRCGHVKSNVYSGPLAVCPKCLEKAMGFSSVTNGISSEHLSLIYSSFDAYIQYSICEGFGCPQTEAGACGLPIITVNYSAMCDIIKYLGAIGIEPSSFFKELETKAIRVYPNNNQLAKEIINLASMDKNKRINIGKQIRELTEKYYNWDNIAKKWEKHLDHLSQTYRSDWNKSPVYLRKDNLNAKISSDQHFNAIMDICKNHLGQPDMAVSMQMLTMLQNADYGFSVHGTNIHKHDYKDIIDFANTMVDNVNQSENARSTNIKFNDDFIEYAAIKSNTTNDINI